MDPQAADMMIGQTVGNYLVTQKLGEGGMGSVYLAEHPHIGKKVALKVLHSEFAANEEVVGRFFNEAKAVNDIQHPNIVDIVDYGIIEAGHGRDQLVYFIMEYLAGTGLSGLIRHEGAMPPERALSIALQVADALGASHKCGIVHRDLKPDNIILVARGRERDFVKLLDFGIAKLTGDHAGSSRTRTGIVMGTPAYMSPEQCEGRGNVDHRTDVYALGIVLYEMLTGRVPFIGEGYGEILVQHLTQMPIPPSQLHMMPPHVEAVVMKSLEKRPDLRYPTMDEMMRAMADPVGYVEAHGGIAGFGQRVLMPSSAPLPMMNRMTPAPTPSLTPIPGSLIGTYTPGPGTLNAPPFTPVPTTLGAAAGQVAPPSGSKTGFILAALAIVAIAAVAIVFVTHNGGGAAAGGAAPGSAGSAGSAGGSLVVSAPGSAGSATTMATVPHDAAAVALPTPADAAGSGSGSGSAVVASAGSGSGSGSGSVSGSGSGSGSGSADAPVAATMKSTPPGAEIWLDNVDSGKQTDLELTIPRSTRKVVVVFKKSGYQDESRDVVPTANLDVEVQLKLVHKMPPHSAISDPGQGHHQQQQNTHQGHHDSDGLMKPGDL